MEIQLLYGSDVPHLDRQVLWEYTLRLANIRHGSLLHIMEVCTDPDGQWVLVLPEVIGRKESWAETVRSMHDLSEPCSLLLTLTELVHMLLSINRREWIVLDWDESVAAVHGVDGWRIAVRPSTPAQVVAARRQQPVFDPHMIAPELLQPGVNWALMAFTEKGDSFNLGALLYELTGGSPYREGVNPPGMVLGGDQPAQLSELRPDLPPELTVFVMKALSTSPEERPALNDWKQMMKKYGGKPLPAPRVAVTETLAPQGGNASPLELTSLKSGKRVEGIHLLGPKGRGGTLFSARLDAGNKEPIPLSGPVILPRQEAPFIPPLHDTPVMPLGKGTPFMPSRNDKPLLPLRSGGEGAAVQSFVPDSMPCGGEVQEVLKRPPLITGADAVDCSVMAPPSVLARGSFLAQVFLHAPSDAEAAKALAREFDPQAQRLGFHPLEVDLLRGAVVMVELVLPGMVVDEPVQRLTWQGRTTSLQFGVDVPAGIAPGVVIGKVTLHLEGVPIGHIRFKLEIAAVQGVATMTPQRLQGEAQRYQEAFISYSSKDRNEVLKRVQMLARCGIHFFQDILDLDPGQRWEQELYKHIDTCDLFLLFWSTSAKESPWVDKEVRYALARHEAGGKDSPAIVPVLIEGPPVPLPPDHLAHLHFNDKLLYFLKDQKG